MGQQHRSGKTVKEQRPCWDEKTLASFAERDCFDVYIHQRNEGDRLRQKHHSKHRWGTRGYEISGLLVYPPWQAELKVDESDGDFGLWFYHSYGRANEARQPLLEIWVSDRDYSIRAAIASAHQAAVISGHKRLTGQVLEAQRDGIFTLEEAAAGCSSDRRYPLNGMYVWEQFESVHLPRWALPTPNERFLSDGMPDWYDRFTRSRPAGFAFESAYL